MKTVKLFEFKDLPKTLQEKVKNVFLNDEVEFQLEHCLPKDVWEYPDEAFRKVVGCSKSYAETTCWFVPACYYETHQKDIDRTVKETLEINLFDKLGHVVNV